MRQENSANQVIAYLSGLPWHYIHKRFRTPLYTYFIVEGSSKLHNADLDFDYALETLYLNTEYACSERSWERLRTLLNNKRKGQANWFLHLLRQTYPWHAAWETWTKNLLQKPLARYSTAQLTKAWQEYVEIVNHFTGPIILPVIIEPNMEEELRQALQKRFSPEEAIRAFDILTTPVKPGVAAEEKLSLLEIAARLKAKQPIDTAIAAHRERFSWMVNNSFTGTFSTAKEVLAQVKKLARENPVAQLQELEAETRHFREQFFHYYTAFDADPATLSLIDTLQESIFYRSWRTERYYRNAYYLQPFFEETAKRLHITKSNDLFYLIPPEIIASLQKGKLVVSKSVISERKAGYWMWGDRQGTTIFSGPSVGHAEASITLFEHHHLTTFQGQGAFAGIVSGPVRIIKDKSLLSTVQAGEVLVTPSTTPDYVPVLRKVAAVITEEGGVLSHASVIARELRIPTIIGVKGATKLLEDGQQVTVDAGQGLITLNEQPVLPDPLPRFYKQEARAGLFQITPPALSCNKGSMDRYFSTTYGDLWLHLKDDHAVILLQEERMEKIAEEFLAHKEFPADWQKKWQKFDHDLTAKSREISKLHLAKCSLEELKLQYEELSRLNGEMWAISIFIDVFDTGKDQEVIQELTKKYGFSTEEAEILLTPSAFSYVTQWEQAVEAYHAHRQDFSQLQHNFFWYRTDYLQFAELTPEFVERQAATHSLPDNTTLKEQQAILARYRLEKNPFALFQTLTQWRDDRKRLNFTALYGLLRVIREAARRQGIAPDRTAFLLPEELPALFAGTFEEKILEKRQGQEALAWYREDGTSSFYFGAEATELFHRLQPATSQLRPEELRGMCACKGTARGRVRIILKAHSPQAQAMEAGDILVTSMTRPEFVPLMRKAAAVITDEGGITSHAAIVSRELGIPCIIGTKVASQVLPEGAMIEVDATNATIRLL